MAGWASFRDAEARSKSCALNHADFTTFSKKAKDVPFEFFKRAFDLILSKSNRATHRSMTADTKKIIAVDSTTMTFGKSKLPWSKYHGEKSGVKLHIHYYVASEMPVKAEESTGLVHDSAVSKYDTFEGAILVKDRAYTDMEVFDIQWIKQNLNAKRIFGTTPNAVYGQLYSSLIAYLIIKIMHVFLLERARVTEYSFIDFYRNLTSENLCTEWVCLLYAFLKNT